MKKSFSLFAFLLVTYPSFAQQPTRQAQITFEKDVIDYGTVEYNSDGKRYLRFTNSGSDTLIIVNLIGSCGCLVPMAPRYPIMPGAIDSIGCQYDTKRVGPFTKSLTLNSNADRNPLVIHVKGRVLKEGEKLE